jgi:hypothetical protein
MGEANLPTSVSQLSRQCRILNILQPYRPPWPVTGIALLYFSWVRQFALVKSQFMFRGDGKDFEDDG